MRRRLSLLLLVAFLTVPLAARSEEPAPPPKPEVAAIAIGDVLDEADATSRTVEALRDSFDPSPIVERIESALPERIAEIDRVESISRSGQALSFDSMDALEAQWEPLAIELPTWRARLAERVDRVVVALDQLDALQQRWEKTREAPTASEAPAAVQQRIAEVLTTLQDAIEVGERRQAHLLTIQAAIGAQAARIEAALAGLQAAREDLVMGIFERDGLPIWSAELRPQLSEDLRLRIGATVRRQLDELVDFLRTNVTEVVLQGVLFVVLAGLLFAARARVRRRSEEERGLERVAEVFEFPVPAALLLAILAAPWLFAYVPPVPAQVLGAAALVPTVLIVRRLVPRQLYPLLYALVGFYFVDRLRELLSPLPVLAHVLFLLELLVAIVLLGVLLHPARLGQIPAYLARRSLRVLGYAGRGAFVLLTTAFVASATGFERLGGLVGSATIESAFVGLVAYAAVRVLDSLVTFALRVWPLGGLNVVERGRYEIRRRVHGLLILAAWAVWATATLDLLKLREPVYEAARRFFVASLTIGSISISLWDLAAFALTVVAAFLLSRFVRAVLEEDVFPRVSLGRGVPYATSTFVHYAILLLGFVLAVAAMGVDLDRFALLAGAFGVGIGFGLQNVVNNFVSGLILLSERPVQVGDMVEFDGSLGEIKRIGIRSSTVRTLDGAEVIVPNADLISQRVINWTLADRQRRLDVPVGVAYGSDRRRVVELLEEVGRAHEDVLEDPPPVALFLGFGDSSLDFELRAWTVAGPRGEFARVRSQLALAIGDALDEEGIVVPFPQRDVHLRHVETPDGA